MDNKKNGSPAASTAMGTVQTISPFYNSMISLNFQGESYSKAEEFAVMAVVENIRASGNLRAYSLGDLANEVVRVTRDIVERMNLPAKAGGRALGWTRPKAISPVQAALLVFEYEHIRMVCTKETVNDPNAEGVLAMYIPDGVNAGIYREIGKGQVDEWCSEIAGAVNMRGKEEFVKKIQDLASRDKYRVCECEDDNLIFMANGIFDYEEKTLNAFDPEIVALRKSDTALPASEPNEPVHIKPDGTMITFWEWLDSLAPYEGGRDLLVKLAGASLRNRHNWRVLVTLFNKTGHNGKSTFLELLKALVGYSGVMTSDLATLAGSAEGGRFGLANIVGKALVTCEDSDSGAYLKGNSRLKSIISHDPISVERKNKTAFDYTPHVLIVAAANDIVKTKDKGQAWRDRNLYVPFTGQFIGTNEDPTIRSQWVVSDEFCEYMAYQALVKWDAYYKLPEPVEALMLKDEWIRDNDPVVDFYEEEIRNHYASFIPSAYAWDMYREWLREERPSTPLPTKMSFSAHFIEVASSGDEWIYPKSGKDGKWLMGKKWCPSIVEKNANGQKYKGNMRGVVRTKVWLWCNEHDTTPEAMGKDAYKALLCQLGLVHDDESE